MSIVFAPFPIPCLVQKEGGDYDEAYLLYVESAGQFENDIWTCVHCTTGIVRHYTTKQIIIHKNATFGIGQTHAQ